MAANDSSGAQHGRRSLILIYDADRTIIGELRYVIGHHILGTVSCALCEISHGPLRQKTAWKAWLDSAAADGLELEIIHRNQMEPDLTEFVRGRLACVVESLAVEGSAARAFRMVLDPDQLVSCDGQVSEFISELSIALAKS